MVQRVAAVAFERIEARAVDMRVQVAPGLPAVNIVGLPDRAVSEAREHVRTALVRRAWRRGESLIARRLAEQKRRGLLRRSRSSLRAIVIQLPNHFKDTQVLSRTEPKLCEVADTPLDLADIKSHQSAKRAGIVPATIPFNGQITRQL